MADELPLEQRAAYSAIIDDILATADLNTISAKRIRKGLQEKVDHDLAPQKDAITNLIMERFDKVQTEAAPPPPKPAPTTTNGHTTSPPASSPKKRKASSDPDDDDDDLSSVIDSPPPKKAKKKAPPKSSAVSDEVLAAKLQAEFNQQSGRATRGGGAKKKSAAKVTKKPKKKSATKISAEDDSEVESGAEKPEKEKKGGFHKPMLLSAPLAALLGSPTLSRPQTVKKIWAYVKERDLQDPSDKRQIRCDEAMQAVFRQEKVHMFTMNKLLAAHYYPMDEVEGEEV